MSENFNMESRSVAAGSDVDWDQFYRQGETPWEKGAPHPALIEWINENPLRGRVLVPGCGFGHDVRALAAAGAEVLGLDIAPFAIAAARAFPRCGHESYILADLFDPGAVRGKFDWVFEHTCFCAIQLDRRGEYARASRRCSNQAVASWRSSFSIQIITRKVRLWLPGG